MRAPPATSTVEALLPALKGAELEDRPVFAEWRVDERRFGAQLDLRMVRTPAAKLTFEYGSGAGELYDLSNDPDELHNVFGLLHAAGLQQELEAHLEERPGVIRDRFDAPVGMS